MLTSHHASWSHSSNKIGDTLAKALDDNDMVLLNTEKQTRINLSISATHRWSLLDLTIAPKNVAHRLSVNVTDNLLGSDHCIIFTRIDCRQTIRINKIPRWNFTKADWEAFQILSEKYLTEINTQSDLESLHQQCVSSLIKAAEKHIPCATRTQHKKTPSLGGM